jgi:hypothetical protein
MMNTRNLGGFRRDLCQSFTTTVRRVKDWQDTDLCSKIAFQNVVFLSLRRAGSVASGVKALAHPTAYWS